MNMTDDRNSSGKSAAVLGDFDHNEPYKSVSKQNATMIDTRKWNNGCTGSQLAILCLFFRLSVVVAINADTFTELVVVKNADICRSSLKFQCYLV